MREVILEGPGTEWPAQTTDLSAYVEVIPGRDGDLVAATHGLGIFLLDIDTIRAAAGK